MFSLKKISLGINDYSLLRLRNVTNTITHVLTNIGEKKVLLVDKFHQALREICNHKNIQNILTFFYLNFRDALKKFFYFM